MLFIIKRFLDRFWIASRINAIISNKFFNKAFNKHKYRGTRKIIASHFKNKLGDGRNGKVLLFNGQKPEYVLQQAIMIKAFERAGYEVVVIIDRYEMIKLYKDMGIVNILNLYKYMPLIRYKTARGVLRKAINAKQLFNYLYHGIRCGRYAISTTMRVYRIGNINEITNDLSKLFRAMERSMCLSIAANNIISNVKPKIMLFSDRGYSPEGEFFDKCIESNVLCYTWNSAHKDNTLMLKKYTKDNMDVHPASLSLESWNKVLDVDWKTNYGDEVKKEILTCYDNSEWYGEAGTQFNKKRMSTASLYDCLQLDKKKKVAVIFSHIFWDATFFWGDDLFDDYQNWFISSVEAARLNRNLNWIIKIHPANAFKNRRDGVNGDSSEKIILSDMFTKMPEHIKIIDENSSISTASLFGLMDFCLTVRGTIGIEAALFGALTLTAGTGRYDRMGFTKDFETKKEYLEYLMKLPDVDAYVENSLAEKYAYGLFMCRTTKLTTIEMKYVKDDFATLSIKAKRTVNENNNELQDIVNISNWIKSKEEDYFRCEQD